MDIDSARLTQYQAATNPVLRERQAEQRDASQAELIAKTVAAHQADLLEWGHDADRSQRGAKALLLDVLT